MTTSTLTHPLTGLDYTEPIYVSPSGRKFYPIGGASDDDGGDGGDGDNGDGTDNGDDSGSGGDGGDGDQGKDTGDKGGDGDGDAFPANTPVKDMTAEQQAAYWKHHARKHETAAKSAAEKIAEFERASLSDSEKAIAEAKDAGKAEAMAELNTKVLEAHVDAFIAANKLKREDVPAIDALDLTKFLTDENDVDTDRLATVLATLAPTTGPGGSGPDMGQGGRGSGAGGSSSGVAAGRDLFASRHGKK